MGFPVAYGGYAKVAWRSYPLVRLSGRKEKEGGARQQEI